LTVVFASRSRELKPRAKRGGQRGGQAKQSRF